MSLYQGIRAMVFGLGQSGQAAARLLLEEGAQVEATDLKGPEELGPLPQGLRLHLGGHPQGLNGMDLLVLSPGVPWELPLLREARKKGIEVLGELELAWRILRARAPELPVYAITGTNGKSTTSALLAHLFRAGGLRCLLGGNIGTPLSALLLEPSFQEAQAVVLEVSSFQLQGVREFAPHGAAILNLAPDHLDRHGSLQEYARAKMRIFENQLEGDFLLLNRDDPLLMEHAGRALAETKGPPRVVFFSLQGEPPAGAYLRAQELWVSLPGQHLALLSTEELPLEGLHNVANALAASVLALLGGLRPQQVAQGLRSFRPLRHRMEPVRELQGVLYINDSKATNPHATASAVRGLRRPVVLIAGGQAKGADFSCLGQALQGRLRAAVLLGEAAEGLAQALRPLCPVHVVADMAQAVHAARALAQEGDVVLLSPACASFDMFQGYEHRGRVFSQEVLRL